MSALATIARKKCNGEFTAKIRFSDRAFYVTIADADIGSLKSLHTLFEYFVWFGPYNFVQIIWYKHFSRNVWRDFRHPMSALATIARKKCNGEFTAKIRFSDRAFYVTIADADIGSLKSLHTLFEYLDHMRVNLEQNRTV